MLTSPSTPSDKKDKVQSTYVTQRTCRNNIVYGENGGPNCVHMSTGSNAALWAEVC